MPKSPTTSLQTSISIENKGLQHSKNIFFMYYRLQLEKKRVK